jgi:hypothetical protein
LKGGGTLDTAVIVMPTTNGRARIVWARIMAQGVNNHPRNASGPLRDRTR